MRAKQFEAALAQLAELLETDSDNAEALYMSAVCHRYLAQFDRAQKDLQSLKRLAPEHSRALQEEGHLFRAMGNTDQALQAYARATQANPALEASWRAQIEILLQKNRAAEARQLKPQLEYLMQLPKPLLAAKDLVAQGKLVKAESLCRKFLQKVPHHVEAMRLLADVGVRLGVLDDAEFLLESALEFEPGNIPVRIDYIQVLRKRQKFEQALAQARQLLDSQPANPQFQSLYAIECMQTGDYEKALDLFDQVLQKLPGDPVTLTSRGHALKTCGKTDAAIDSYRAAIAAKAAHGEAWYSLANLKTVSFSEDDIARMRAQEASGNLGVMDRIYLFFALGKAFEDIADYEQSFLYYEQGNQLKRSQSRYQADKITEEFRLQQQVVTPAMVQGYTGAGCEAPDPIFIVGLPRAGSTLLEQILSSHSLVDGTLELPNVLSLVHRLRRGERFGEGNHYPSVLAELSAEQYREFGEAYIRDTRIHRRGAPFFIDKMPNNFRHIGLIKLMLPNAKIIDARRHPMACCFSGYKQLFAEGQEFSYSLQDIGQYYRDYVELMDYWHQLFSGQILHVQYEDVVDDFESQVRRILDYCGLEFEADCLSFYKTERAVRTASSEQVRQPLYRSGLEQWRNFEAYLEPLKQALGPEILQRYPIKE